MVKACSVPPYAGGKPFLLVHFSREDEGEAFTLIERLAAMGYRVGYAQTSSGQMAGEAARRLSECLNACAAVAALYSPEAAADHDFRKVITSAVLSGKPVLPVFLEDFELSPGMRAQPEPGERVSWEGLPGELAQPGRWRAAEAARGEPDPAIRVEQRARCVRENAVSPGGERPQWPVSAILVDEEEILRRKGLSGNGARRQAPPSAERLPRTVSRTVTVVEPEAFTPRRSADAGRGGTLIPEEIPPVCVLLRTGERMTGRCGLTRIGRGGMCDIRIPEDTVSSLHLEVYSFSDADGSFRNTLIDCHSSNGSWVGGKRLAAGERLSVDGHVCVGLGRKVRLFLAFGHEAQALMRRERLYTLECVETRGIQVICGEEVVLGRNDPFHDGLFDFPQISREHARLRCAADGCTITDQSSNGTLVNGRRVARYSTAALKDGDEIVMGTHRYQFRAIVMRACAGTPAAAQPPEAY